jgi:hypothetical protein
MTIFESIILAVYYVFACVYMCFSVINEEDKGFGDFLFRLFAAATIGIVIFPGIFAADIWEKLNG